MFLWDNISPYSVERKAYPFPVKSGIISGTCSRIWHIKYTAQAWNYMFAMQGLGNTPSAVMGFLDGVMHAVEVVRLLLKCTGKTRCCARRKC